MVRAPILALFGVALFAACDRQDAPARTEAPAPETLASTASATTLRAVPSAGTHTTSAAPVGASPCHALPPGVEDLSALLEPIRQRNDLPALAAAIVTPEGVKSMGVVGVRRYGDPTPACVDDAFQLGSDTKAMSAVTIARAVEQGRLSWSTTIGETFADVTGRNRAYDSVTLEQLLAHRGGFTHDPKSMTLDELKRLPGTPHEQREAYARIVLREAPASTPGTQFSYSNTGYTLAGIMTERATGQIWEDLFRVAIFQPLGLTGGGFGPSSSTSHVDGPWPHVMNGSVPTPLVPDATAFNPLFRTPAGNVKMPVGDWARFAEDTLRSFEGKGALLSPTAYQRIHTAPFGGNYSYGWYAVQKEWTAGTAYAHSGSDLRNYALAWVVPQRHVAFLVETNIGKVKAPVAEVLRALRQRVPGCAGGDDDTPGGGE